jgi:anti-sigma B factor antagonist
VDIKLEKNADVMQVKIIGEVNMNNSNNLREVFKSILKKGETKILIDFDKVDFIDSSGIATLIEMFRDLKKINGRFILCHVNQKILNVLEITKVYKLFGIYDNNEKGIAALRS